MQAMTRKNLEAKETRRRVSAVQHPKVLVLHHRVLNPTVLEDCVIDAENHTLRNMKAVCKAKTAKCNGCGEIGHYKNYCKKAGNFPKKPQHTKKMHITGIVEQEFYDEEGNRATVSSQHMPSMKHSKPQQELLVQFGIGKDFHSIDKKVTLKLDTGADVNAFNQTTFQKLFPDVVLQPSTIVLENFDKTMMKLMGTFKCFLRWKGKAYRIQAEVIDSEDTPNVLSRETTFPHGHSETLFCSQKSFRYSRWNSYNELPFQGRNE